MTDRPIRSISSDPIAWPDRTFYLHVYYDGHNQLVLRSPRHDPPRESQSTRIDTQFKGVEYVNIPAKMSGLTIRVVDAATRSALLATTSLGTDTSDDIFAVHGNRWAGFIVAEDAFTTEDEVEDLYAPSAVTDDFRVRFNPPDDPNTIYVEVVRHDHLEDKPVLVYSEVVAWREVRKVEIYRNGRTGFADRWTTTGTTQLSEGAFPTIQEIAAQPEFSPFEIDRDEFFAVLENALQEQE